jgi:hypothetical protein
VAKVLEQRCGCRHDRCEGGADPDDDGDLGDGQHERANRLKEYSESGRADPVFT